MSFVSVNRPYVWPFIWRDKDNNPTTGIDQKGNLWFFSPYEAVWSMPTAHVSGAHILSKLTARRPTTGSWLFDLASQANWEYQINNSAGAAKVTALELTNTQDKPYLKGYGFWAWDGLQISGSAEPICMAATDLTMHASQAARISSASHIFTTAEIGTRIQITGGAGWTSGEYYIVSIPAAGAALLNAAPAAAGTTGGQWNMNRGRMISTEGSDGVADTLRICRKDAADVFGWTDLH